MDANEIASLIAECTFCTCNYQHSALCYYAGTWTICGTIGQLLTKTKRSINDDWCNSNPKYLIRVEHLIY